MTLSDIVVDSHIEHQRLRTVVVDVDQQAAVDTGVRPLQVSEQQVVALHLYHVLVVVVFRSISFGGGGRGVIIM